MPNLNLKLDKIKKFKELKREERLPELYDKCKKIANYIPRRRQDTAPYPSLVHAAFTCMNLPEKCTESFVNTDPEDIITLALTYPLHDFTIHALLAFVATHHTEKILKKTSLREIFFTGKNNILRFEVPFPRITKVLKGDTGVIFSRSPVFNNTGEVCAVQTQQHIKFFCPVTGNEVYEPIKKANDKEFKYMHFSLDDRYLFCEGDGLEFVKYEIANREKKYNPKNLNATPPIPFSPSKSKLFKETMGKNQKFFSPNSSTGTTQNGLTTTMTIPPFSTSTFSPNLSKNTPAPHHKKKSTSKQEIKKLSTNKMLDNQLLPPYKNIEIKQCTKNWNGNLKKMPYFWDKNLLTFIEPLTNLNSANPDKTFCSLSKDGDLGVCVNGKTVRFFKYGNIYSPNIALLILCAYKFAQSNSTVLELKSKWCSDAFYQLTEDEQKTFCHIFRCKAPVKKTSSMKLDEPVIKNTKDSKTPRS